MSRIVSRRPLPEEYDGHEYADRLIGRVEGECVLKVLDAQLTPLCEIACGIGTDQIDTVHPPYGWTIRQVYTHVADSERVFGYRMLRFAAGDPTELPGFDENAYVASRFGLSGKLSRLIEEIGWLRQANLLMLKRLRPPAWERYGVAEGRRINVRALAWLAAGHLQHHLQIIQKRIGASETP